MPIPEKVSSFWLSGIGTAPTRRLTSLSSERGIAQQLSLPVPVFGGALWLTTIHPFAGNPFKVREDENLSEMAESIKLFGLINPVSVRERDDGAGFELIAGQRRLKAMEMA